MSLVIRLARAGTKKRPVYHVVVADNRAPRDGRFIERLGYFNPLLPKEKTERLKLDLEKVQAWMKKGAQPSDRVMVIPKQYLKTIKRTGLGKGLFSEMRYNDDGSENPNFVLNKAAYRKAKILVAGDNFGCGSSREHAPWALMDFGIRCVISTSFGDIFYNNCFKNGVLPIRVSPEDLEKLFDDADRGANATLTIDLEKQEIRGPDGGVVRFEIDAHRKHCMKTSMCGITLNAIRFGNFLVCTSSSVKTALLCENSSSIASLPAPDTDW